jgi:hypothetical protein
MFSQGFAAGFWPPHRKKPADEASGRADCGRVAKILKALKKREYRTDRKQFRFNRRYCFRIPGNTGTKPARISPQSRMTEISRP